MKMIHRLRRPIADESFRRWIVTEIIGSLAKHREEWVTEYERLSPSPILSANRSRNGLGSVGLLAMTRRNRVPNTARMPRSPANGLRNRLAQSPIWFGESARQFTWPESRVRAVQPSLSTGRSASTGVRPNRVGNCPCVGIYFIGCNVSTTLA